MGTLRQMMPLLAAAAILLPAAAGRAATAGPPAKGAVMPPPAASGITAPASAEPPLTLATVGGKEVTSAEVDVELGGSLRLRHAKDSEEKKGIIKEALERVIAARLLKAEAERRGLGADLRYSVPLELMRDLRLVDAYIRATYDKRFAATPEELKPYSPREWVQVKLRGIFFSTREEAEAARPDIVENKDNFGAMFDKYSIMQTAKKGDLGFMFPGLGYFATEDDDILFKLGKGEVSPPLKTEVAWAIVLVEEKKKLTQPEIDGLMSETKRKIRDDKVGRHIAGLKKDLDFKLYPEALQAALEDELAFRKPDRVVLELEGTLVTFLNLQNVMTKLPESFATTVTVASLSPTYQNYIDQCVMARAVADEAKEAGFAAPPPDARSSKAEGMIMVRVLCGDIFKDASVTEEGVKDFYERNKKSFYREMMLKLGEIVLSDEQFAKMIRESISTGAQSFQRIAGDVTEDPVGKLTGGVVSVMDLSAYPPEFQEVINKTEAGQVTPVLKGSDGKFHVFKVISREKDFQASYEQVRWDVARTLLRDKQQKILYDFVEGLKDKADIKRFDENLDLYLTRTKRHGS